MEYAVYNYEPVTVYQSERGFCPECREELTKVFCNDSGRISHWRHRSESQCKYGEGETGWHRHMRGLFPPEMRHVYVGRRHIYDVLLPNGTAVEFQHSGIYTEDIISRNNHTREIIWVFDCTEQYGKGNIRVMGTDFSYDFPKKNITAHCPNVHLYLRSGLIIQPTEGGQTMTVQCNPVTGFNMQTWKGSCVKMNEDQFVEYCYYTDENISEVKTRLWKKFMWINCPAEEVR